MKRVLLATLLLSSTVLADPSPSPTPHRRVTIGDVERAQTRGRFIRTIEAMIPFGLAVFLGLRSGNVRVEGDVGPIRITTGSEMKGSAEKK